MTPFGVTARHISVNCKSGNFYSLLTHLCSLPSAAVAKTILHGASGSSTKFSWVLVDAEHGLISDTHYYEVCPQTQFRIEFPSSQTEADRDIAQQRRWF